jgi:hypothetical protein
MTMDELKKLSASKVRQIARSLNLIIYLPGTTKAEIIGYIIDRLGSPEENRVGWKLLDQYQ